MGSYGHDHYLYRRDGGRQYKPVVVAALAALTKSGIYPEQLT